ncbi:hypothetical protein AAVH_34500, partial [Aphelenchoides avenae]
MPLSTSSILLTGAELALLVVHVSVFACICRQICAKVPLYTSAFFKIYLFRCLADYAAYLLGCLLWRLMDAEIVSTTSELFIFKIWPSSIMFSVFLELLLYTAVVLNRYTAISQPFRHGK